jgi:hypothetical protein
VLAVVFLVIGLVLVNQIVERSEEQGVRRAMLHGLLAAAVVVTGLRLYRGRGRTPSSKPAPAHSARSKENVLYVVLIVTVLMGVVIIWVGADRRSQSVAASRPVAAPGTQEATPAVSGPAPEEETPRPAPSQQDQPDFESQVRLAEWGDAAAQAYLGWMYEQGKGVQQNHVEAVRWYRKAADQEHAGAQASLGFAYFDGKGVGQDKVKAVRWYRKAAEHGDATSQYFVGWAYEAGYGVARDAAAATHWYRKAADQGNAEAQKGLARLGVPYEPPR